MIEVDGLDALSQQAADLERNLGGAEAVAAEFNDALGRLRESFTYTGREVDVLGQGIGRSLKRAFDGVVFDGVKLSDALKSVVESVSQTAYSVAMKPVQDALGGAISEGITGLVSSLFPFAKGAAFSQGQVMPFAKGGVVSSPTSFPMRNATGLMGEAGPEAIMPLARGADGRLGVQAAGGKTINVVMNVTTPDAAGFSRSQSQIAAQINRALARGSRNA